MKGLINRTIAKAQSRLMTGDTMTVNRISELAKYNDVNPKIATKMHGLVADITAKNRPTGKKNMPTPQL